MRRSVLAAVLVLLHASISFAQSTATTRLIPYSGTALDGSGAPVRGSVAVTFELYEEQEGGAPLWRETQQVQADERGRYLAHLGSVIAIPQVAFSEERARWLAVRIGDRELPRVMLVAVPYALRAADADTLGGRPASSFVRQRADGKLETSTGVVVSAPVIDGSGNTNSLAKFNSPTTVTSAAISEVGGRVGFGLADPTGGGVVDSVFTIRNFDNNTGFGILNETQQRRFAINTLPTGGWLLYDGSNDTWNPGLWQRGGRVAIGTPFQLTGRLNVFVTDSGFQLNDGIWSQANSGTAIVADTFTSNGTGNALSAQAWHGAAVTASTVTGTGLVVSSTFGVAAHFAVGRVGIGTDTPADLLDVKGDIRVGTGVIGCVKDSDGTVIAGVCSSDVRLKKNVAPFESSLDKLNQLQPVYFDWRADQFPERHLGASRSFGLIAQDVEAVLPELVVVDEQGYKAVKYNQLPFHLLQAIKELKTENDDLREQLNTQEERLRRLETLIRR